MSLLSPPQIPLFRITLFYGPEAVEGEPDSIHCVFNVKKRSWKGGAQIDVMIKENQLTRIEEMLQHPMWLENVLKTLSGEEREDYVAKSRDLLIQLLCFYKLQIRIQQGITQTNMQIPGDSFILEMYEIVQQEEKEIKRQISVELDVRSSEENL